MAATAWTKKLSIATTLAGEPSTSATVYLPGANATLANINAGGATTDSALADIGAIPLSINGTEVYVLCTLTS